MKTITTIALLLCSIGVWGQSIGKPKDTTPDTVKRYHFTESEAILIDNLMGQLDVATGNSDKISTSQYNSIHRAVLMVDSLVKVQYFRYHPAKDKKGAGK